MERLLSLLPFIPFLKITNSNRDITAKVNYTRIVETIIMAVIAGAFTSYLTVQDIKISNQYRDEKITKIEFKIDKIYNDFYKPF